MKRSCLRLCFAVLFGFVCATGGIPTICAQESEESGTDEFQLEEITVTAQKRSEDVQKVAIQMEVIQGEDLQGTGKDNVDDILRDISSIMINKNDDGMRISIRGLTDDATYSDLHNSNPMVAVNIDGAYSGSSSAGQNMFDIERVEVLVGPQSTLYGNNSPGGIVNVVTASPKADKFSGSVSGELGNYGLFDGQLALNIPIVKDLLAIRFAGQAFQRETWIVGNSNEQDSKTMRLKTMIEPSDTFKATITANYAVKASNGRLSGTTRLFDYQDGYWANDDLTQGDPVTNPWTSATWDTELDDSSPQKSDSETKGLSAEISWDAAFGTITFVPSYSKQISDSASNDVEVTFAGDDGIYYTNQIRENYSVTKQAELRITSPEDFPFQWIIGGTMVDEKKERNTQDLIYPVNDSAWIITQEKEAIYANITYPITDRFRGNLGYRQSWDKAQTQTVPAKAGTTGISGQSYDNPDYKVGLEYDLSENSMIYGNWATSYRTDPMGVGEAGGYNPQELKAYTLGSKSRFLDNKLQVNASAFFYDYQNKFFRPNFSDGSWPRGAIFRESDYPYTDRDTGEEHPGVDYNNDGDYVDTNLRAGDPNLLPGESSDLAGGRIGDPWKQYGSFESKGVDVSVDWVPSAKDRVSFGVSYLDSIWTDAVMQFFYYMIWEEEGKDYGGSAETYSPTWSAHGSYRHIFDLGSFGTLIPQIDFQYKSEYELSFLDMYQPYSYQEPHTIFNASMAFNHSSGKWSVNTYAKNLTDYAAKTFLNGRQTTVTLGLTDPMTYGAVLSMKF